MSAETYDSTKSVSGSQSDSDQYAVGYQKPPKHSQFKPGQSGNPQGRPKGLKNLATDLSEELNEKILVTESGQSIEVTKQRALIKTMIAKSLKGDARTMSALMNLIVGIEQSAQNKILDDDVLSEDDQHILTAFTQKILNDSGHNRDRSSDRDAS